MADAIEAARALLQAGDVDGAVRGFLRAGAFDEAAVALAGKGRYMDAANLLMNALGVGVGLLGGLDPAKKKLAALAAQAFALGGDVDTSMKMYAELGEPMRVVEVLERAGNKAGLERVRAALAKSAPAPEGRAGETGRMVAFRLERAGQNAEALAKYLELRQLPDAARVAEAMGKHGEAARLYDEAGLPLDTARCWKALGETAKSLDALVRVQKDHLHYREACLQAIRAVVELNAFDFKVDQLLSRFLSEGPTSEGELAAFYDLGNVYSARDFGDSALEVYRKIQAFKPGYRDVVEKIAAHQVDERGSTRAYEAIVKEDARFHGKPLARDERSPAKAAEPSELPELPSLPPIGMAASAPAPPAPAGPVVKRTAIASPRGRDTELVGSRPAMAAVKAPVAVAPPAAPPPPAPAPIGPLNALVPGTKIAGRYEVQAKLGEGGMAAVYRVTDIELGEPIALKIFFKQTDAGLLQRFKQEVTLSRQLAHPNVVRLYDIGSHDGFKFLTMELLVGKDLRSVMDDGRPDITVALKYLTHACAGLAVAHERGIIHRDLKPDNLFLTTDGTLKVMDFGIAKDRKAVQAMTQVGFIAGTPLYMSPEQINDFASANHLSDLYSLGVIAYELLTGSVPFTHDNMLGLFLMHQTQAPEPLRAKAPHIPEELEDIVLRLLEKQPRNRIQSCRDLMSMLAEIRPRAPRAPR